MSFGALAERANPETRDSGFDASAYALSASADSYPAKLA